MADHFHRNAHVNIQELALQYLNREAYSMRDYRHNRDLVGMGVPQIDPEDLRVSMEMHHRVTTMLDSAPCRRCVVAVYVSREICK